MKRGNNAVKSHPALMELAEMLVLGRKRVNTSKRSSSVADVPELYEVAARSYCSVGARNIEPTAHIILPAR